MITIKNRWLNTTCFLFLLLFMMNCSTPRKGIEMKEFPISDDSIATAGTLKENEPEIIEEDIAYFEEDFIRNRDFIYHRNIRTVQLTRSDDPLSQPIIRIRNNEKLKLSFDDLDSDVKDYRYTVIHCDANWQESDLYKNEYIEGFTEDKIDNYKFSFNTIQTYTHYYLMFPTENLRFTLSGNYILKVYVGDESNMAFTLRFMVLDQKLSITGKVKRASAIIDRNYRQEVDFEINTSNYPVTEPYRNLNVIIMQNYRWDNAIMNLKPKLVVGDKLDYNYDEENVFNGTNEFRNFDIKSLRYRSPRIKGITFENDTNHVYLWEDRTRTFTVYSYDKDINGMRFISCEDVDDIDIECDYTYVDFLLPHTTSYKDGQLYIFGALTNYQLINESRLVFNSEKGGYEASLYLKEGYYNYCYAYLPNNANQVDLTKIEGNHFDTENDYTILVYYRRPGEIYDALIGMEVINSLGN